MITVVYVDDCMHIYKGGPDVRKGLYEILRKAKLPQQTVQVLSTGQNVSYLGMNISRKSNVHHPGEIYKSHIGEIYTIQEVCHALCRGFIQSTIIRVVELTNQCYSIFVIVDEVNVSGNENSS